MHTRKREWAPQRRTKARLICWLSPGVLAALRAQATVHRMPVSTLTEYLIRAGLEHGAARQLEETALPVLADTIRAVLEDHAHHMEERLAKLLARNVLICDTTRRLLFAHMARQWGGAEKIRATHDSACTASVNALREKGWAAALRLDAEDLFA
jgi:hypothetical protein